MHLESAFASTQTAVLMHDPTVETAGVLPAAYQVVQYVLTWSSTSSMLKTLVDWVPPLLKDLLGPFFTNRALMVQFML